MARMATAELPRLAKPTSHVTDEQREASKLSKASIRNGSSRCGTGSPESLRSTTLRPFPRGLLIGSSGLRRARREPCSVRGSLSGGKSRVTRAELQELHFIAPITNVASILQHGILSHNRARNVAHESVAMSEIQDRRRVVVIPRGQRLHDYVNLYISARNKMLFRLKSQRGDDTLCVLRVSTAVLDLPSVVISDSNASSDYCRFAGSPEGLGLIDRNLVFARYWTHPDDPIEEMRHGSVMCAEVLVPDCVDPGFIMGAYVSCRKRSRPCRRQLLACRRQLTAISFSAEGRSHAPNLAGRPV